MLRLHQEPGWEQVTSAVWTRRWPRGLAVVATIAPRFQVWAIVALDNLDLKVREGEKAATDNRE